MQELCAYTCVYTCVYHEYFSLFLTAVNTFSCLFSEKYFLSFEVPPFHLAVVIALIISELFEVELLQFELSSSRRREDNKIFIILSGIKNKILDNLSEFPTRDALDLYMMEDETTING